MSIFGDKILVPKKVQTIYNIYIYIYIDTTTDHITPCSRMRARGNNQTLKIGQFAYFDPLVFKIGCNHWNQHLILAQSNKYDDLNVISFAFSKSQRTIYCLSIPRLYNQASTVQWRIWGGGGGGGGGRGLVRTPPLSSGI